MADPRIAKKALLAEFPGCDSVLMDLEGRRHHRISERGTFIWKALEAGLGDAQIVEALARKFDVSREIAETNVKHFLEDLSRRGLVHDTASSIR